MTLILEKISKQRQHSPLFRAILIIPRKMKTPPQDIKNPDSSISIKKKTAITLKK
jgi:hypothetical protein